MRLHRVPILFSLGQIFPGYRGQAAGWHAPMVHGCHQYVLPKPMVWRFKFEALFQFPQKNIIDETSRIIDQISRRCSSRGSAVLSYHVTPSLRLPPSRRSVRRDWDGPMVLGCGHAPRTCGLRVGGWLVTATRHLVHFAFHARRCPYLFQPVDRATSHPQLAGMAAAPRPLRQLLDAHPVEARFAARAHHFAIAIRSSYRSRRPSVSKTAKMASWSTPDEVVRLEVWLCHRGGLQWRRSTSLKRSSRSCGRLMF